MQVMDLRNLEKKLNSFGIVTERSIAEYETRTPQLLTTTPTKISLGWSGTLENITFDNGDFIVGQKGEYRWSLERQYQNNDQNTNGVSITLQIRLNNIVQYERTAPIMDAISPQTPGYETFTTEFSSTAEEGDRFSMWVIASDDGSNPASTSLKLMRILAEKTRHI